MGIVRRHARAYVALIVALAAAIGAEAHDFWLQPERFAAAPGESVRIWMYVGHLDAPELWNIAASRIARLESIGPGGRADARAAISDADRVSVAQMKFSAPGDYIVALESHPSLSELDHQRFLDHVRTEGLTAVSTHLANAKAQAPVYRELYSRRAKSFVRVGGGDAQMAARYAEPIGHTLELVPERDPSIQASQLPVRVLYRGQPLRGAKVGLAFLGDPRAVSERLTGDDGRVIFEGPTPGSWRLDVVWSEPLPSGSAAAFETFFASLTFETAP